MSTQNKWVLDFCGCCSYKNPEGKSTCFPDFFPKALLGTCFLVGEAWSNNKNEEIVCCNMGWSGIGCCSKIRYTCKK